MSRESEPCHGPGFALPSALLAPTSGPWLLPTHMPESPGAPGGAAGESVLPLTQIRTGPAPSLHTVPGSLGMQLLSSVYLTHVATGTFSCGPLWDRRENCFLCRLRGGISGLSEMRALVWPHGVRQLCTCPPRCISRDAQGSDSHRLTNQASASSLLLAGPRGVQRHVANVAVLMTGVDASFHSLVGLGFLLRVLTSGPDPCLHGTAYLQKLSGRSGPSSSPLQNLHVSPNLPLHLQCPSLSGVQLRRVCSGCGGMPSRFLPPQCCFSR